jgi:hypothetical protein
VRALLKACESFKEKQLFCFMIGAALKKKSHKIYADRPAIARAIGEQRRVEPVGSGFDTV